ncbi:MAG TPA: SGNH hydrolase domain-containing protein, partial [Nocardioides sp.]|nr:SGNH hydrolase domain-containing protein [Nocardioides sp.]
FEDVIPIPALAAKDWSPAFAEVSGRDCRALPNAYWMRTCVFGRPHGRVHIAMLGNSHADQWLPALQAIAGADELRVVTRVASRCAAANTRQVLPTALASERCQRWVQEAVHETARSHPDLVVMSDRISSVSRDHPLSPAEYRAYVAGYRWTLRTLADAGVRVLVVRDTPTPGDVDVPECVAENEDDPSRCDGVRSSWVLPDPTMDVVRQMHDDLITSVDLNDHICGPERCTVITGGVITYVDASHISATYSRTLGPYLGAAIKAALAGSGS